MKIVDLNVVVYATNTASHHHPSASAWFDHAIGGVGTIGIPTAVAVGFVRITTNPRIMTDPLSTSEASHIVRSWLARPNVVTPHPTDRHFDVLDELLAATGRGGNLVSDAHLAALAIEYSAELYSYDNDFARFPGVIWRSP